MAAPSTIDELLDVIRKSGMVDEPDLEAYLQRLSPEERALEPARFARHMIRAGLITQFQAEQFLQGKFRGLTLGKYKVLERLGSGGMALVYLCEHPTMKKRVAVKVLPTVNAKDAGYLKRFYREARVAAVLDHPNICRAFDIDQDEKYHYMIMEFVDGGLIHDIVSRFGAMDITRACHYVRQTAIGLQHAHEAGLVHRDIKPDNLIVDRSGTVKILDMGLARFLDDSEEVLTRGMLGTPDYCAPEQARDSHHVDCRADIYSLGCAFYFMLTGRTPFGDESPAKLLIMHQTIYPTSVRLIRPEVPEGLEKIVDKMMDKDPDQRYQVPIEVAQALEPWTRTPIPPPSEEELPRLSPAIRAENPEPRVAITPRPGNRGVQTGADIEITPHNTPGRRTVPEQAPLEVPFSPPAPRPSPAPRLPVVSPPPARQAAPEKPVPPPRQAPPPRGAPERKVSPALPPVRSAPRSPAQTVPASPPPPAPSEPIAPRRGLPQWLLLTLAFIAMLAAGAALGWVFLRSRFF